MRELELSQEQYLLSEIKVDNKEAFSLIFQSYYLDLVLFAGNFIHSKQVCEDIVQSVFLRLWNDRTNIQIEISLKSFLLKAVRNSCLDEFRHLEVVRQYEVDYENSILNSYDTENYILYSDLYDHLYRALEQIPELYREAFMMNRFEGLKYKEIAKKLNVSERTVEVRVSKTLGLLRKQLKDFFVLLISIAIP